MIILEFLVIAAVLLLFMVFFVSLLMKQGKQMKEDCSIKPEGKSEEKAKL